MSWKVEKLNDAYIVKDGTHDSPKYQSIGYPLITSKNLKNGVLNFDKINFISNIDYDNINKRSKVEVGDVLFAMIGTIGNPVLIENEPKFAIKNVALFKKSKNSSKYLLYFLKSDSVIQKMQSESKGATQKFVSLGYLRNLEIPIPSLSEQQAIVEKLDAAFALIDQAKANIEKNIQNAKELFQSKLNQIFSQKGEGWEERKLGEICIIKPPKKEAKEVVGVEDLVTFLPMEDLGIYAKETTPNKARKLKEVSGSYTYFKEGDILLAKITPCFENGKLSIARNLVNKIGFGSSEYVVFRTNKELLNEYLFYFLSRDTFRAEGKRKMQGAVGHKRISKEFIEDALIYLPSLHTQQEIVLQLDALSEQTKQLEAKYQTKLANLEELRKSILEKAFKGELVQMSESQISTD